MGNIQSLSDKWLRASIAPQDTDLEACVIDGRGVHAGVPFPQTWDYLVEASTTKRVDIQTTRWRQWTQVKPLRLSLEPSDLRRLSLFFGDKLGEHRSLRVGLGFEQKLEPSDICLRVSGLVGPGGAGGLNPRRAFWAGIHEATLKTSCGGASVSAHWRG
jgi:hypothetical protein